MHIRLNEIDGFIAVCDGTRFLVLFIHRKYDKRVLFKLKEWY